MIFDKLIESFKEAVLDKLENFMLGITSQIDGLEDLLLATPSDTQGLFGDSTMVANFIETIAIKVIMPIAGLILVYVIVRDLLDDVMEKNNFGRMETGTMIKFIFKMALSVLIASNAMVLVNGLWGLGSWTFSQTQSIVNIQTIDGVELKTQFALILEDAGFGSLLNLWISLTLVDLVSAIIGIIAKLIIYGRLLQMMMYSVFAPIPFASAGNRQISLMENYVKNILALSLQGFLIIFVISLYSMLINAQLASFTVGDSLLGIAGKLYSLVGWGILLIIALGKTHSITKSIFGAH